MRVRSPSPASNSSSNKENIDPRDFGRFADNWNNGGAIEVREQVNGEGNGIDPVEQENRIIHPDEQGNRILEPEEQANGVDPEDQEHGIIDQEDQGNGDPIDYHNFRELENGHIVCGCGWLVPNLMGLIYHWTDSH